MQPKLEVPAVELLRIAKSQKMARVRVNRPTVKWIPIFNGKTGKHVRFPGIVKKDHSYFHMELVNGSKEATLQAERDLTSCLRAILKDAQAAEQLSPWKA